MKIRKTSEVKILDDNLFAIFLRLIKQRQIQWKQIPFKYEGSGSIEKYKYENVFKKIIFGTINRDGIPAKKWGYAFKVWVLKNEGEQAKYLIQLLLNGRSEPFAKWNNINDIDSFFSKVGIEITDTIDYDEALIDKNRRKFMGKDTYYVKRFTKVKDEKWPPLEIFLLLRAKNIEEKRFAPTVYINQLDKSEKGTESLASAFLGKEQNEEGYSFSKSLKVIDDIEKGLKDLGFEDSSSYNYIPEGADQFNFDFYLNKFKKDIEKDESLLDDIGFDFDVIDDDDDFDIDALLKDSVSKIRNVVSQNNNFENFEGYFSGEIPDYAANLVGTSSVDASQIESSFGKASEAVRMVNEFDSSFLKNIAYIFDFAQGSAYGVYIPKLDEAIKTKSLKQKLESQGYSIKDEGGMLVAYHDQKSQEEIQKEIDSLYTPLKTQGGHVISVNTNKILNDAKLDVEAIYPLVEAVWTEQETWENFSILHLGETIVHEATHAQGYDDEGMPTQQQKRFVEFALNKMNQKLQADMNAANLGDRFEPIPSMTNTRRASLIQFKNKLFKKSNSYIPSHLLNKPSGSDIDGRYKGINNRQNPGWGMMDHLNSNQPIEQKLGRDFMAPLPDGLSQEHDHIDLQLRKMTDGDIVNDPSHSIERLLTEFHGTTDSYELVETLLENRRPQPLMLPISKKEASSKKQMIKNSYLSKEATLFGWYNNLEISDGSTIPGLGDRVMAWDDRDESFAKEEDWIKAQPRYNPQDYTAKGFRYQWVEPRFKPRLWDDVVSENIGNIHPAKRFGSTESEEKDKIKKELNQIIVVISDARKEILEKKINGTRFLISEDLLPHVKKLFEDMPSSFYSIDCFSSEIPSKDDIYSLWVVNDEISEEDVQLAEDFMQGRNDEGYATAEHILKRNCKDDIQEVIKECMDICVKHDLDIYVVGEPARKLIHDSYDLSHIDFCGTVDETMKFAHMLAEKLGVNGIDYAHNNQIATFFYKGIELDFNIGFYPDKLISKKQLGHFSNVHKDLINRDFKLNMVGFSLLTGKHENPFKVNLDSVTLETLFEPKKVLNINPSIMLRAMALVLEEGFKLSPELENEIRRRGDVYLQKCSTEKKEYYRERLEFCGKNKLSHFLDQMNLTKF